MGACRAGRLSPGKSQSVPAKVVMTCCPKAGQMKPRHAAKAARYRRPIQGNIPVTETVWVLDRFILCHWKSPTWNYGSSAGKDAVGARRRDSLDHRRGLGDAGRGLVSAPGTPAALQWSSAITLCWLRTQQWRSARK